MATPTTFDVIINTTSKSIRVRKKRFTANELYSYLMDTFDEQAYMDDLIPMNAKTPTLYELINGWTFSPNSTEFLYSGAVTETRNGTVDFNVWTNVKSLGAIESGSTLYVQQGTLVTYEGSYPFNNSLPVGTEGGESTMVVTTSTIPVAIPSSGSITLGVGTANEEQVPYTAWFNSGAKGQFTISTPPANSHAVDECVTAPMTGHFDILLQTILDDTDVDGTTFTTYCRLFQKTYSDFTTTGGAVVANVPVSSASDPFLTTGLATCKGYESTITIEWMTSNIRRSAFDGTANVQEYILQTGIDNDDLAVVVSTTIAASVGATGYFQIEEEVFHYASWDNGDDNYGTFTVDQRGTFETTAVAHLAGKDVSTATFEYNVLVQMTDDLDLQIVYNFLQYEMLQRYDIDDAAGYHIGRITDPLASYTGMLWTVAGVWVENFSADDKSNIRYRDVNSGLHTPPTYITLKIDASTDMAAGRAAMYRLNAPYDPDAYTIVATYLDNTLDPSGDLSTTIKYVDAYYVLVRTRKAGYLPFETGAQITTAGLTVLASNPDDTIYT